MKDTKCFNGKQFSELYHALKTDGCFSEDIPNEELVRFFAEVLLLGFIFGVILEVGEYGYRQIRCQNREIFSYGRHRNSIAWGNVPFTNPNQKLPNEAQASSGSLVVK